MPQIETPESPLVAQLSGVHLFGFDAAPCSQRVQFALAEKGLRRGRSVPWLSARPRDVTAAAGTYSFRSVSLTRHDNLTPEYAAIQPNMVVPALVHDGRLYVESMDIIEYLDQAWPERPLIPPDTKAAELAGSLVSRAKALHVSVRHITFNYSLGALGRLKPAQLKQVAQLEQAGSPEQLADFYARFSTKAIPRETFVAHLHALEEGFAELESLLRSDQRPFLTGDALSVADIIWSIKVMRLVECGYPFAQSCPAVSQWYRRIAKRPAFRDGVARRNRFFHYFFRSTSAIERFFGKGVAHDSAHVSEVTS
jgi:glutathione S-transferase